MDPFSIFVGTVGLADVSTRVINYLTSIYRESADIGVEINTLSQEIATLTAVHDSVKDFWDSMHDSSSFATMVGDESHAGHLWKCLASLLQKSSGTIEQLENLLKEVIGKKGPLVTSKFDGLRKTIRRRGRDGEYMRIRHRLAADQTSVQMLLLALNITYTSKTHTLGNLAVGGIPDSLQHQIAELQSKISELRRDLRGPADVDDLHDYLVSADAVASLVRFNKHFDMPQNVSSYYTGRQKQLDELKSALNLDASRERQDHQKRFVIYGLGGSGKSQFCCKFAQDNREYFWGVFWINGSSYENAKHSYAKIAKIGGVEPNENAAKNWLSNLQQPWLLLIDNANDPEIDVMRYVPTGDRGIILITTHNPTNKRHGTEGSRFFHFNGLETEEANDLLLSAAAVPRPWELSARNCADRIAKILGYLPLALIHAGKAILEKLCSLGDYPEYYERTWHSIRRSRSRRPFWGHEYEHTSKMSVYSSYEIIYIGLESKNDRQSRDALDLLKIFSFFHWENIEFDIIKTAAINPRREREYGYSKEHI
ncbi:hypothetical protein FQN49_004223, partial [Arthroderma sp. PD_2]